MTTGDDEALQDAVALATLLADAKRRGIGWDEPLLLAESLAGQDGARVLMAQTHHFLASLQLLSELLNAWPLDVKLPGPTWDDVERPATVQSLLEDFGMAAAPEGDGSD